MRSGRVNQGDATYDPLFPWRAMFGVRSGVWLAALVAAAAGCATTLSPCPARGGATWREVSSEHFDLRTDLDADDAQTVVQALEDTRAAMLALFWKGGDPPHRTQVITFASASDRDVFLGPNLVGRYIRPTPFLPSIVFAGSDFTATPVLRHELAHDLGHWFLPLQPDWVSEGIATFLETVHYDRERKRGYVGEVPERWLRTVRRWGVLDVERLLVMETPADELGLNQFEASSWVLVHYLLNHRNDSFVRFQRRLGTMQSARQAWQAEFGDLDLPTLTRTLTEYAWQGSFKVVEVPFGLRDWEMQSRSLSDAEVHGIRAYLFSLFHPTDRGPDLKATSAEIAEALSTKRAPMDALAVAFYRPPAQISRDARVALAQRAVATHPESWLAWLMVADATDAKDPAHGSALARALARAPENREVLGRLAVSMANQRRWADALPFSRKAIRTNSQDLVVFLVHFRALAETGQCAEAALWVNALSEIVRSTESAKVSDAWKNLRQTCATTTPAVVPPAPAVRSGRVELPQYCYHQNLNLPAGCGRAAESFE